MALKSWMDRGSRAALMGSCLWLSGCGSEAEPEVADKQTPVQIPVEAPAPALNDNELPMFADDGTMSKPNKPDDVVSQLQLPPPILPEANASDDEPETNINPADAVHRGPWLQNHASAIKQAKAEGKDILMDFTGSNWCGYCIRLNRDVFSRDQFVAYAPKKFVLLELDFPKPGHPDPKIQAQNDDLQRRFNVEGFPTIVLCDSEGRPYAVTGYQPGGPNEYIEHLEELRAIKTKRDEKFAAAAKAKGAERAQLLAEGLDSLIGPKLRLDPNMLLPAYISVAKEIVAADADGKAGLKEEWSNRLRFADFAARVDQLNEFARTNIKNVPVVFAEITKVEGEFKDFPQGLQRLRDFRLSVLMVNERTDEFQALADQFLQDKSLTANDHLEIIGRKLEVLVRDKKLAAASKVVTTALAAHPDDKVYLTQLYLFRARLAALQRNKEEALTALKLARKQGVADFEKSIDRFEEDILDDLEDAPAITPKGGQ